MKLQRRKRRSLVRILASWIPNFLWSLFLPVPPRMYITAKVKNIISSFKQTNQPEDDDSFYNFKSYFQNRKEKQFFNSTPIKQHGQDNNRITQLQKELDEIKKQIAKLMEHQCDQFQCSGYGTLSNPENMQKKTLVTPIGCEKPPPPPPPMPNFQLATVTTPLKLDTKKKNILPPIRNGLPTGKELLRDLKKVQLRKVEKSPGGGPLKKSKKIDDPGDFLEAVLKRRFGQVQKSPESSVESISIDTNDSFNSGTTNSNFDIQRNLKSTFT